MADTEDGWETVAEAPAPAQDDGWETVQEAPAPDGLATEKTGFFSELGKNFNVLGNKVQEGVLGSVKKSLDATPQERLEAAGAGFARGLTIPEGIAIAGKTAYGNVESLLSRGKPLSSEEMRQSAADVTEPVTTAMEKAPAFGTIGETAGSFVPIPGPKTSLTGEAFRKGGEAIDFARSLPTRLEKSVETTALKTFGSEEAKAALKDPAALKQLLESGVPFEDIRKTALGEASTLVGESGKKVKDIERLSKEQILQDKLNAQEEARQALAGIDQQKRTLGSLQTETGLQQQEAKVGQKLEAVKARTKTQQEVSDLQTNLRKIQESGASSDVIRRQEDLARRQSALKLKDSLDNESHELETLTSRLERESAAGLEQDVTTALDNAKTNIKETGAARDAFLDSDEMLSIVRPTTSDRLHNLVTDLQTDPLFANNPVTADTEFLKIHRLAARMEEGLGASKRDVASQLIDLRSKVYDSIDFTEPNFAKAKAMKTAIASKIKDELHNVDPRFAAFDAAFHHHYQARDALQKLAAKKGIGADLERAYIPNAQKAAKSGDAVGEALSREGVSPEGLSAVQDLNNLPEVAAAQEKVTQATNDFNLAQAAVKDGRMTAEQARLGEKQSALAQAFSIKDQLAGKAQGGREAQVSSAEQQAQQSLADIETKRKFATEKFGLAEKRAAVQGEKAQKMTELTEAGRSLPAEVIPEAHREEYLKLKEILPNVASGLGKEMKEEETIALAKQIVDSLDRDPLGPRAASALKSYTGSPEEIKTLLAKSTSAEDKSDAHWLKRMLMSKMVGKIGGAGFGAATGGIPGAVLGAGVGHLAESGLRAAHQPLQSLERVAKATKKIEDLASQAVQAGAQPGLIQGIVQKYGDTTLARILIARELDKLGEKK